MARAAADRSADVRRAAGVPPAARDVGALSRFDTFLFAGIATVLVTRFFLAVTGYPQVGGGGLHVAHVLWGGLLMGVAIAMMLVGMGSRLRLRAAFVGGIGFGLFIDEIGKFLTKDVNYFFEPAVAIIYGVFMAFYLVVREIIGRRRLTDARRNALGAAAVADQSLGELDDGRRAAVLALLREVDVEADVAAALRTALLSQPVSPPRVEARLTRVRDRFLLAATGLLASRRVRRVVISLFVLGSTVVLASTVVDVVTDAFDSSGGDGGVQVTELAALASGSLAAVVTLVGVGLLARSRRIPALRTLQAAVLIDILVTDIFQFATIQFAALAGFAVQIVVLGVLRLALRAELLDPASHLAPSDLDDRADALAPSR